MGIITRNVSRGSKLVTAGKTFFLQFILVPVVCEKNLSPKRILKYNTALILPKYNQA